MIGLTKSNRWPLEQCVQTAARGWSDAMNLSEMLRRRPTSDKKHHVPQWQMVASSKHVGWEIEPPLSLYKNKLNKQNIPGNVRFECCFFKIRQKSKLKLKWTYFYSFTKVWCSVSKRTKHYPGLTYTFILKSLILRM